MKTHLSCYGPLLVCFYTVWRPFFRLCMSYLLTVRLLFSHWRGFVSYSPGPSPDAKTVHMSTSHMFMRGHTKKRFCSNNTDIVFQTFWVRRGTRNSVVKNKPVCPNNTLLSMTCYTGCFYLSIQTRNGPTGAPFILSRCDLLQFVANVGEFSLILWHMAIHFIRSCRKAEKKRGGKVRFENTFYFSRTKTS